MALGATLYALRDNKLLLAGFFSAKTRKHQVTWLPCEVEAQSIASAIKHFAPYIIQSKFRTCVLADSKPCVQSFEKLCRGQFSVRLPAHLLPPSFPPPADTRYHTATFLALPTRETTTSFTTSCILEDECHDTLRASLIFLCLELCPISGPCAVIRVHPAPGFASLSNNEELRRHKITVEIGRVKNVKKNPVAEKYIAELGDELLRVSPEGGAVSPVTLAIATTNLNTRIRDRGLSAR